MTIDKLAWLHIVNKKLLCARSKSKELYYIPGGKREIGETDEAALSREIREELSIDLIPGTIEFAGSFSAQADGKPEGTEVQMTCYFADYSGDLAPDAEIEEIAWFTYEDKSRCSTVTQIIIDYLKSQNKL